MTERAEYIKDEHLEYLDDLRDSGVTNMWGARPYIMKEYPDLEESEAKAILIYWIDTFPRS